MKFELFNVVFSDVGFRDNRNARYRLKFFARHCWHILYYETYADVFRAIKQIDR